MGAGENHFGIVIFDPHQRINLPLEGIGIIHAVCHLDINLLIAFDSNKVDFLFVQYPGIKLISPAQQFNGNDVLNHPAIIGVLGAQLGIFEGMITQIILVIGSQIPLPLNVITPHLIECERIAQIFDVSADGAVVGGHLLFIEVGGHAASGGQIGDIVDEEITETLHQRHIPNIILTLDVSHNQRVEHIRNITVFCLRRLIQIGAGHAAFLNIAGERGIGIIQLKILHELHEGEGINLDLKGTACEQCRQIAAQQEGIGTCDVDVIFLGGMETVDGLLKAITHLHFINKYIVILAIHIGILNVLIQRVMLHEILIDFQIEIDVNHIRVLISRCNIRHERLQQLGFPAAAHTRDDLDVGRSHNFFQLVQVIISLDQTHHSSPRFTL